MKRAHSTRSLGMTLLLALAACTVLILGGCAGDATPTADGPGGTAPRDGLGWTDGAAGDAAADRTWPLPDARADGAMPADGPPPATDAARVDGAPADAPRRDGPCTPSCAGRACGDDGCGGSCGACESWERCDSAGQCACDEPLPSGWPAGWTPWSRNPVLLPTKAVSVQGQDNIYAPEIHAVSGGYAMWYGGQGGDGHDRIFVATSLDGVEWRKWPADAAPSPVLDRGASNHVNDPSVVRVGSTWHMFYTDAPVGIDDRIWVARSTKLTGFAKVQQVLGPGAAGSWESLKVGRPAVLYEGGVYRMWYDGQDGSSRHVGYASSTDGVTFTRFAGNPVLKNAGAIDVKQVGGVYVMLREGGSGTSWATSKDGVHCWKDRGQLFGKSGAAYDAFGQVTPFLELRNGVAHAIWFGGASVSSWDRNRVALALPAGGSLPGGGCTACTPAGWSCSAACQGAGAAVRGVCAAPGSTNPGACCACSAGGCESCTGSAPDCHAACVGAGKAGGFCAHPGSTNPGVCCACWE